MVVVYDLCAAMEGELKDFGFKDDEDFGLRRA
jgi:hypothetical protein